MKGSQQGQLGNLNRYNQSRIINCLWDAKKATRHYLSHETGLSIPTISHALISLTKEHLVQVETEKTTGKRGGRPAEWFYFSGSENFAIGIDLEKEISFCLLADLEGNIKERISWKTPSRPTPHALITDVLKHIRRMEEKVPSGAYLRGIGIALPGLVSRYTGKVIYSHTFEWHNIEFVNAIRKEIEYPVFIDNEANLLSLGELYFGS
ncbi:MAG: ROK family protein, partial [Candidatus Marinimicrobia bacterium]|nr:ROK family protein [Candidatus Neomarinimicrobiota bacterium]